MRREHDDNGQQMLVTAVYDGGYVTGANVWVRGKDEAVFVQGDDLKRVAAELSHLAEERRTG